MWKLALKLIRILIITVGLRVQILPDSVALVTGLLFFSSLCLNVEKCSYIFLRNLYFFNVITEQTEVYD